MFKSIAWFRGVCLNQLPGSGVYVFTVGVMILNGDGERDQLNPFSGKFRNIKPQP